MRWAIGLSVIPGLLAAAAILYAIRHTARPATREGVPIRIQVRPVLRGDLGRLLAAITAFEVGNVAATLLILRATELLTSEHGWHSRPDLGPRRRRGTVLAAYVGFAFDTTNLLLLALPFAAGIAIGCVETAQHAAVAALAPPAVRGSACGLLATVQAGGNLAASAIAGILWTVTTPTIAFGYLAAWMLLALAGLTTAARHNR